MTEFSFVSYTLQKKKKKRPRLIYKFNIENNRVSLIFSQTIVRSFPFSSQVQIRRESREPHPKRRS